MRHSLIYCRNCPHLFDGFYPRTGTSSIFPSAAHCLDISPDCPGFLRFSHSLFTCCSPILSSTKTSQSLSCLNMRRSRRRTPDRVFRISAKAHALAMQGRQPPMGGQSLIRGLALESSSYVVSSGYLCSGVIGFPTFLCGNPLSRHLLVLKIAFAIILTARPFWRYHLDSAPHFHGLKIPIAVCRVMGFLCSTAHHCSVN